MYFPTVVETESDPSTLLDAVRRASLQDGRVTQLQNIDDASESDNLLADFLLIRIP